MTSRRKTARAPLPDADTDRFEGIIASKAENTERRQGEEARAQLAAIVETSDDAIVSYDPDGTVLSWNGAAERMLGYPAAEMIGRNISVLAPPERMHESQHSAWLLKHGKPVPSFESERVTKDGREVQVQVSTSAVRDTAGNVVRIAAILRDVTERKEAEAVRARLVAIIESANDAIIGRTLDGTILAWNAGAERIFGYTKAEALGRKISMLIPPERREVFEANQMLLRDGRRITHFESIQLAKDGRRIPVSVSVSPIRDEQGRVMGVSIIVQDISERKRAEEARAQLAAIVENSTVAIFTRTLDGIITSWNAGAEKMLGYTAAEAIGKPTTFSLPPGRPPNMARNNEKMLRGEVVAPHESRRMTKDGRVIDVLTSYSPIKDGAGNIVCVSVILQDITAPLEAEKHFRLSAAVFETTQEGIMVTDASNRVIMVNPAFTRITGHTRDEVIGKPPSILSSGVQDEAFYKTMWASIKDTGRWRGEIRDRRKNGEIYCEWLSISTVKNAQGEILYHAAIFSDITKQKQAEESRAQLAAIVENSGDAIISRGLDRTILTWNAAAERLFGYTAAEVIGQPTSLLIPPEYEAQAAQKRTSLNYTRPIPAYDSIRLAKDGRRIDVSISQSPINDSNGKLTGVSIAFRDITERKQAAERIDYLAQYDTVTGLPNRRLFNDRLTLAMARDKRLGAMTAVLLVDLDRFKQINESLGHSVGDKVLQAVTARLRSLLREVDTIARFGGDEFVVILESVTEKAQAARVAEKIVDAMAESLMMEGEEVFVTASVGVALYPDDADSLEKLIENAELAMYQAKREGRNTLQLYAPEQNSRRAGGFSMESKLRRALERDEFVLHFQPKVNIKTGAITGAEALIRWRNPELGLVSPADFIPLAEETGLIVPIGEWVLHSACNQASAWHRQGHPLSMAVNLSARQFHQKNLCEMVQQTLADSGLEARYLEFEITESMIMRRPEQTITTLQQLHDIGLTLSVDDFGTGYSSLSYLKRFPVHKLKVDQSFVRDLNQNADDAAIVRTVIALARNLNLKTVAEGVETEQQLIFLAGLDCDEYQGYYFSKPVPAAEFLSLLQAKQAAAADVVKPDPLSADSVNRIAAALRTSQ